MGKPELSEKFEFNKQNTKLKKNKENNKLRSQKFKGNKICNINEKKEGDTEQDNQNTNDNMVSFSIFSFP